jgi:hypothetical protein
MMEIHAGCACPATLIWNHWLSALRPIRVTGAPFFNDVTILALVLGLARTFALATLILPSTGAGVGGAGVAVGNGVGSDGVFVR